MGRKAILLPTLFSTCSWEPIKTLITQVVGKLFILLYGGLSCLSKYWISSVLRMFPLGTPVPLKPSPSSLSSSGTVRSVYSMEVAVGALLCVSLPLTHLILWPWSWVWLGWHWLWVSMHPPPPAWLLFSKRRRPEPRPLRPPGFLLPDGLVWLPSGPEDAPQPVLTHSSERLYPETWVQILAFFRLYFASGTVPHPWVKAQDGTVQGPFPGIRQLPHADPSPLNRCFLLFQFHLHFQL